MAEFLDARARGEVRQLLGGLRGLVKLIFFTQSHPCTHCREERQLLEELTSLSDKLTLEIHDFTREAALAREYGVDKVPGIAVIGRKDYGIRFFGVTAGYEFGSLIEAILIAAGGQSGLSPEIEALVNLIDRPVHLEVMVTATCPYCPQMVHLAHRLAVANDFIRSDMVDAGEYPHLIQRYGVNGVPQTIVNGRAAFQGALPPAQAILEILRWVRPEEYERIEAALREARGLRAATGHVEGEYEVAIVGVGPAGLNAAIYAARKNRRVLLIGDRPGGQVADTASVENWLGFPSVNGRDLTELFRDHAEGYPLAEQLHARIESIRATGSGFLMADNQGREYRARAVIYCGGKSYRRLNVPGEERFLGRGIAFCATCDAPLFQDKRVAVVGGGNSAFTAARDLLHYAREIHLIYPGSEFKADPVLQAQVREAPHVQIHTGMTVKEYLGEEQLTALRLESVGGEERMDLATDGVFLEIGLAPNSAPLNGLVALNDRGEVPVNRDQSTAVPGLFAAGDVTDEPEKQIVVAAAAGAKAALAADRYLDTLPPRAAQAAPQPETAGSGEAIEGQSPPAAE